MNELEMLEDWRSQDPSRSYTVSVSDHAIVGLYGDGVPWSYDNWRGRWQAPTLEAAVHGAINNWNYSSDKEEVRLKIDGKDYVLIAV